MYSYVVIYVVLVYVFFFCLIYFIFLMFEVLLFFCFFFMSYAVLFSGMVMFIFFFFSRKRRHTRCALVTGVQTCALPICPLLPRRLMVRLRILIPSIEVRILAGHPVTSDTLLNVLSFPWGNQHPFLRLALRTAGKRSGFSGKISPIVLKQPGTIPGGINADAKPWIGRIVRPPATGEPTRPRFNPGGDPKAR